MSHGVIIMTLRQNFSQDSGRLANKSWENLRTDVKFLGIKIYFCLNWNKFIEDIVTKLSSSCSQMIVLRNEIDLLTDLNHDLLRLFLFYYNMVSNSGERHREQN